MSKRDGIDIILMTIIIVSAFMLCVSLSGCWSMVPRMPAISTPGLPTGSPGTLLTKIAFAFTAIAGIGLLACAALAWFWPNKLQIAKLAIACVCVIICTQILFWLGQHLALAAGLAVAVLAAGGALYLFIHRKDIERRTGIDLDGDGKVGDRTTIIHSIKATT
jgi:hypothetical protein